MAVNNNTPSFALSLYDITVTAVANNYTQLKTEIKLLPETVIFDVYIKLYHQNKNNLCALCVEFCDLDVFAKMLNIVKSRVVLMKCFQALMKHGCCVAQELVSSYKSRAESSLKNKDTAAMDSLVKLGVRLGGFLGDAGWFEESISILTCCLELCQALPDVFSHWKRTLDCCSRLMCVQNCFSKINDALATSRLAEGIIEKIERSGTPYCFSEIHTQFSLCFFHLFNYTEAYNWGIKAVKELGPEAGVTVTVEALSQAAKTCVVKRDYSKAEALIRLAVYVAAKSFGTSHPKYADALHDYAFYLLNCDAVKDSVTVYRRVYNLKLDILGQDNLHVAAVEEDLAYALYVFEYSSGRFTDARSLMDEVLSTLQKLLPEDHLKLASAQRVKALILEEIALDRMSHYMDSHTHYLAYSEGKLLSEAEKLHTNALELSLAFYGEDNIQTAKHYGNLGRLYQSMKKLEEAEKMHLKAIEIKEKLLGENDYEVGLSLGHLASLYNYQMKQYRKAEKLYLRSININLKLFSESYSGLEYDYRGLVNVYDNLGDKQSAEDYQMILERWKACRLDKEQKESSPLAVDEPPFSLAHIQAII